MIRTSLGVLILSCALPLQAEESIEAPQEASYPPGGSTYQSRAVIQIFPSDTGPKLEHGEEIKSIEALLVEHFPQAIPSLFPDEADGHAAIIRRMKAEAEVENIPGTGLLEIITKSTNKAFSRDLANQLVSGYQESRMEDGGKPAMVHQEAEIGELVEDDARVSTETGGDPLPAFELKGEWLMISSPKGEWLTREDWTTAVRVDTITSFACDQILREDLIKAGEPYPMTIGIMTNEPVAGRGGSRPREVLARGFTNLTAPKAMAELVTLLDQAGKANGRE